MKHYIIEGQYTVAPEYQQWTMPGWTPPRFWDVVTVEDETELAAYLAGQQPFIEEEKPRFPAIFYGQEVKRGSNFATDVAKNATGAGTQKVPCGTNAVATHVCARCNKPCKPQFKLCYRCNQYNKVKARLAHEL